MSHTRVMCSSQWATLSRSLVEHLLDQETHSNIWRTYDFHMQVHLSELNCALHLFCRRA